MYSLETVQDWEQISLTKSKGKVRCFHLSWNCRMLWNQVEDRKGNITITFKNTGEIISQEKKDQQNTTIWMLYNPLPLISASKLSNNKLLLLANFNPKVPHIGWVTWSIPPSWAALARCKHMLNSPTSLQISGIWGKFYLWNIQLHHLCAVMSASCFVLRASSLLGTRLGLILQFLMHPSSSADGAIYPTTSELYTLLNVYIEKYIHFLVYRKEWKRSEVCYNEITAVLTDTLNFSNPHQVRRALERKSMSSTDHSAEPQPSETKVVLCKLPQHEQLQQALLTWRYPPR